MGFYEDQLKHLTDTYIKAERNIFRQLMRLEALPDSGDKSTRLARIENMQKQTQAELVKLGAFSQKWAKDSIGEMYNDGVKDAQSQIKQATGKLFGGVGGFHIHAIANMSEKAMSRFAEVMITAERKTMDIYNEARLNVHLFDAVTGIESWRKLNHRLLDELEAKGVTGFVDKAGREWNLSVYTEMLARTTMMNAHREANINELRLRGYDLVKISSHGTVCKLCIPWEGAILSISGDSNKYPSLADAEAAGLFHPNCLHSETGWFDLDDDEEDDEPRVDEQEQQEPESEPRPELELSIRERLEKACEGLGDKEKTFVIPAFENAQEEIIQLFEEHKDAIKFKYMQVTPAGRKNPAYFDPRDETVYIDHSVATGKRMLETVRHEFGHLFDYAEAKKNSTGTAFISYAGKIGESLDEARRLLKTSRTKEARELKEKLTRDVVASSGKFHSSPHVSDSVCGITKRKLHGRYSHKKEYYASNNPRWKTEVFAHLMDLEAENTNSSAETIKYLQECFPGIVEAFQKWLYKK